MRKLVSWCLLPFTIWYAVVVVIRNWLFDLGVLKSYESSLLTICVGNLTCGGTGKTPHVEYLLRLFGGGSDLAVLSRGYKRKTKGYVLDDGEHSVSAIGDESAMIASKFGDIRVAVCEKRADGLRCLEKLAPCPRLVILDDAYQHRFVKPDINILLTDYNRIYTKDFVLPMGDLREPRFGSARANIIIVTKCPEKFDPYERYAIERSLTVKKYQTLYFSYMRYGAMRPLYGGECLQLDKLTDVVLLTGIADSAPIVEHIKNHDVRVCELAYDDHHQFTALEVQQALKKLQELPQQSSAIVVTEKDAVRLQDEELKAILCDNRVCVLPIEVAFHHSVGKDFDTQILEMVVAEENVVNR